MNVLLNLGLVKDVSRYIESIQVKIYNEIEQFVNENYKDKLGLKKEEIIFILYDMAKIIELKFNPYLTMVINKNLIKFKRRDQREPPLAGSWLFSQLVENNYRICFIILRTYNKHIPTWFEDKYNYLK